MQDRGCEGAHGGPLPRSIVRGSLSSKILEVQGRKIIVVSLDGLREMKRLAGRLRDQDDLEHLPTE